MTLELVGPATSRWPSRRAPTTGCARTPTLRDEVEALLGPGALVLARTNGAASLGDG